MAEIAERLRELANKWKSAAMADVPPSYADRDLHHKYLKLDNYASGQDDCADELLEFAERLRSAAEKDSL